MEQVYAGNAEPSIDELLNDDIARLLRLRDGLHLADVLCVVEHARGTLRDNDADDTQT
jgi:hypothetical protein